MKVFELFESKPPRNALEAFVKPYIEQLVGKEPGTYVDIPFRVKDWTFIEVRTAIGLWMNRLVTHCQTNMYRMSYIKKKNHFTVTLKEPPLIKND